MANALAPRMRTGWGEGIRSVPAFPYDVHDIVSLDRVCDALE